MDDFEKFYKSGNKEEFDNKREEITDLLKKCFVDLSEFYELSDSKENLNKIIDRVISGTKKILLEKKHLLAGSYFIYRNYKENKYEVGLYPMPNFNPGDMQFHAMAVKLIIEAVDKNSKGERKLISVITATEGYMSMQGADAVDIKGNIIRDKIIQPSKDPNAKEVLLFSIEEEFYKRTLALETMRNSDNDVVINDKPLVDHKSTYDVRSAKVSTLGWFLTRGQGMN